jgi:prepilin-type N-terminal cleavage/methylation domain-containing protein
VEGEEGFTFVELLIGISIVGVLIAAAVGIIVKLINKGDNEPDLGELRD